MGPSEDGHFFIKTQRRCIQGVKSLTSFNTVYFDDPFLNCKFNEAGTGMDVELLTDVRLMSDDGLGADAQHVGHFLVRMSLGN
jgi:hypothetical protein